MREARLLRCAALACLAHVATAMGIGREGQETGDEGTWGFDFGPEVPGTYLPTPFGIEKLPAETQSFATEKEWLRFKAARHFAGVLRTGTKSVVIPAFNPGVTSLAKGSIAFHEIRRALQEKNRLIPGADVAYVAAFKNGPAQCDRFPSHEEHYERGQARRAGRLRVAATSFYTKYAILDEKLRVVALVGSDPSAEPILRGDGLRTNLMLERLHDVRITDMGRGAEGLYLRTGWIVNKRRKVVFKIDWLHLSVSALGDVVGKILPLADEVLPGILEQNGKNLGVLWDGDDSKGLEIVTWLGDKCVTVQQWPFAGDNGRNATCGTPLNSRIRNGGTPIDLEPFCPGFYMGVGHLNLDYGPRGDIGTKWGNTYVQYAVVFRKEQPHHTLAVRGPFCFPSVHQPERCDWVQFLSEPLLVENSTVIFPYGVNDCESAYARMPVEKVLDFVFMANREARERHCLI
uniref:Uncharacterized protein n=1 Tax=Phaeomonas parva TaxID=124430 RepID=A0A7S1UH56_9STRA|mmetsp:Transcript_4692/g.13359  ORF Transcript_4692/g.13359 Transcript_4692/m.13359 type:complete len:460 (+) Transcript_4692:248-1627(+)